MDVMTLSFANGKELQISNLVELASALDGLNDHDNSSAILSADDDNYVQAAFYKNGYHIEMRNGSEEKQFFAGNAGGYMEFTLEQVKASFSQFWANEPQPDFIKWLETSGLKPSFLAAEPPRHLYLPDHPVITRLNIAVWKYDEFMGRASIFLIPASIMILLILVLIKWIWF